MTTRLRHLAPVLVALALACLPATAAGAETAGHAAAKTLAQAYVPITMLREQQEPPCETSAEQYRPTSVDTVLGNPGVTLAHDAPGKGLENVKKAPTAADIVWSAGAGGARSGSSSSSPCSASWSARS